MRVSLLLILLGIGLYLGWTELTKSREHWFLKALTDIPLFNTSVDLDLNQSIDWDEKGLQTAYPHLYFICDQEPSELGERVCWVPISTFNKMPVNDIAFFFDAGRYSGFRISAKAEHHNRIRSHIAAKHYYYGPSEGSKEKFGQEIGIWFSESGRISTYLKPPLDGSDTLLMWKRI